VPGESALSKRAAGVPTLASGELTDSKLVRLAEECSGARSALSEYLGMSEGTLYRRPKTLSHAGIRKRRSSRTSNKTAPRALPEAGYARGATLL
jgi:hypothetical protein